MANMYIGNRYVPKVMGNWNNETSYESLSIVLYQGNSYTSKTNVPSGILPTNEEFWVLSGNYNGQVEQYRQEIQNAVKVVNDKLDSFEDVQQGKFQIMMNEYKGEINAYVSGKYSDINADVENLNKVLETTNTNLNSKLETTKTNIQSSINNYTNIVDSQLRRVQEIITSIDIVYDEGTSTDIEGDNITIIEGNGGIN